MGMRKPETRFFEEVVRSMGMEKREGEILFLDDNAANIQAAEGVGMRGWTFDIDKQHDMIHDLGKLFGGDCGGRSELKLEVLGITGLSKVTDSDATFALRRSVGYLEENKTRLWIVTDGGIEIYDNFSQLLILELTGDW